MSKLTRNQWIIIAASAVGVIVLVTAGILIGAANKRAREAEDTTEELQAQLDSLETSEAVESTPTASDEATLEPEPLVEETPEEEPEDEPEPPQASSTARYSGIIEGITPRGGGIYNVGIDEVAFLLGNEAAAAASALGQPVPPNPEGYPKFFFVLNEDPAIVGFDTATSVKVVVWTWLVDQGELPEKLTITVEQLRQRLFVQNDTRLQEAVWWITVTNGKITAIEEERQQWPEYTP